MKLLIATPLYPPEPGGPATYVKLLEEGLPAFGIEVTVVKFSGVRHLPKIARHIAYMRKLVSEGRKADAILALDPVSTGLPAAITARILRRPFVVKVVGDYAWEQGRQRFGITQSLDAFIHTTHVPWMVSLLRGIQTWVADQARVVLVPSEYLKKVVTSWGIEDGRISIVNNAITFQEGGEVPNKVLNLPSPRIVTIARLVPWKGIDGLIKAMAEARKSGPLSLVVIGEGPERSRLEALAADRLKDGYVFTGLLQPKDTHATLAACDIFVLNSSYEGLSHTLIEALVSGKAIVASQAGGNSEVITDESGILVPVGDTSALTDALVRLTNEPSLRDSLHQGALKRAEEFSVPVMLKRTNEVLSQLV